MKNEEKWKEEKNWINLLNMAKLIWPYVEKMKEKGKRFPKE